MLTLNDGRAELWQWDTGRTLAVDADCSQVHFSNKVFGRSIDVDVADGVAIIPDILLQTDKDLNVWAFVGTAENGYTKISKTFKVNRRNKPADYVFTPTDQITIQTIQRQIGDLSDLTTEAKDTLVAAINEAAQSGGGGGTSDHSMLSNRDAANQHPMSAITGLEKALESKQPAGAYLTDKDLDTTLKETGKAADAAEVGKRLSSLSEEIANIPSGKDGVGIQSVEQTATSTEDGGTNVITVTKTDGTTSTFYIKNGSKGSAGPAGANGHTPVKGTDYWTIADQQAIVDEVLAALPIWEGGSY